MMRTPRDKDICIRVLSAAPVGDQTQQQFDQADTGIRRYEVAVYTSSTFISLPPGQSSRAAAEWMGTPLRSVGWITIKWERYQDILGQFFLGEKGLEAMYYRLYDALSPELRDLSDQLLTATFPISVWFSFEASELEDMPWELLFYNKPGAPSPPLGVRVARGLPPASPTPVLPVSGPLRVLWSDTPDTPQWMRTLFAGNSFPGIKAIPSPEPLRQRLRAAAASGFEIVHLCTDGSISLAYEGVLSCSLTNEEAISAPELSRILLGSRISLLALSATDLPPTHTLDAPASVYRAFAYFASSKVQLPSMVVPIGPNTESGLPLFWSVFYSSFGSTHRLDEAFAAAKHAVRASTFALFLRHSHGKLFRKVDAAESIPSPAQMATDLQFSLDFNERLRVLGAKYGELPDYVNSYAHKENQRRQNIEAELEKWTPAEGEE
jgi:hypothetical protein